MKAGYAIPALAGLLFGAGLMVSGMADFTRVLGFLTFAPGWDPTLLFVMIGALAVTLPGFALARRRGQPWFAAAFANPTASGIDRRLLIGSAIFGLGWGLQGYCPGPAVVAAGLGQWPALVLLPAMLVGAWVADLVSSRGA